MITISPWDWLNKLATTTRRPAKTTENPVHEFHFDNNIDNHNNNIDNNDNHYYYYDQYDGVAEAKEDDVVYNNDYQADYNYKDYQQQQDEDYNDYRQVEVDYKDYKDDDARRTTGVMCPGSLDQCIEACVPLQDIYVYSLCVVECGKRCN